MTRKLEVLGEHTIDTSLLEGGFVLDAGCRDFTFAREIRARGGVVVALDADPTVEDPHVHGIIFRNVALSATPGSRIFVMTADPQARHLQGLYSEPVGERVLVTAITVDDLAAKYGTFDAVKLDIEGSEYGVLRAWPGPIAKQISIEFHEHVSPRPQQVYDEIFRRLGSWYDVVQHEKTARHCCAPNYWDTLLVLKPDVFKAGA